MNEMEFSQFEKCYFYIVKSNKSSKKCININAIKLNVHK